MPGMDGFQAVQAIKNNPRTATIPIMMYTSQEGELYLSQARALGAIGVLPKQIKHADVSKVLEQLHLLRRATPEPSWRRSRARVAGAPSCRAEPMPPRDTAPPLDITERAPRPERPQAAAAAAGSAAGVEGMLAHHMLEVRALHRRATWRAVPTASSATCGCCCRIRCRRRARPALPRARRDWRLWLAAAAVVAALLFGLQWSQQRGSARRCRRSWRRRSSS